MKITLDTMDKVFRAKKSSVETMELKGYRLIEEFFVDSSGFGADYELALTKENFLVKLTELLKEHGQLTAKITGNGQFQVYVGLFKKNTRAVGKIVGNNTLEIKKDHKRIIRLYDTDILTFLDNGKIVFNSGGFNTRTTTARMNEFLYKGYVYRKNWELMYHYNGKDYKFENDTLTV